MWNLTDKMRQKCVKLHAQQAAIAHLEGDWTREIAYLKLRVAVDAEQVLLSDVVHRRDVLEGVDAHPGFRCHGEAVRHRIHHWHHAVREYSSAQETKVLTCEAPILRMSESIKNMFQNLCAAYCSGVVPKYTELNHMNVRAQKRMSGTCTKCTPKLAFWHLKECSSAWKTNT